MKKDISLEKFQHPLTQPKNWQDFEDMCKDLLDLEYSNALKKAEINESTIQDGVDAYKTLRTGEVIGIQCKKIDLDNKDGRLTPASIDEEIEKAKNFEPKLSLFIIATSVKVTDETFKYIRKRSHELETAGLFSISFWGPKKLTDLLNEHKTIFKRYFPEYFKGASVTFTCDLFKDINNPSVALTKIEELWKEAEATASDPEKAKILSQWAVSLCALGKTQEAATKIMQSYDLNPDNENVLSNMASAYSMLQNKDKAIEFAKKTLEKFPKNANANHILILDIIEKKKDIIAYAKTLDEDLVNDLSIASTISQILVDRGDFKNARLYLEQARSSYTKEKGKYQKLRFLLAEFESIKLHPVFFTKPNREKEMARLKELRKDLSELWNSIEDSLEKKEHLFCAFAIIEISNILEDYDFSKSFISEIMQIDTNNPLVVHEVSFTYFSQNLYPKVIEYLEEKKEFLNDTSKTTLALSYAETLDFDSSIKSIEDIMGSAKSADIKALLIIKIFPILKKNNISVEKVLSKIKEYSDFLYFLAKYEATGEPNNLLEANKLVKNETPRIYLRLLADKLYKRGYYAEAKSLFEKFVDMSVYSNEVYYYAICLMEEESIGKALELLESFKKEELDLAAIGFLYRTYYIAGDMLKAKTILEENYNKLDDNFKIEHLRAKIFSEDLQDIFEKADLIERKSLSSSDIVRLAGIYSHLGKKDVSIDLLYERIKEGTATDTIEATYANLNIFSKPTMPVIIDENVGVTLQDKHKKTKKFIIETPVPNLTFIEVYPHTHPLVELCLGKKAGDKIQYRSNSFSVAEEFTILEIWPKHIAVSQEIFKDFNVRHPGTKTLFSMKVDSENPLDGFKAAREVMLESHKFTDTVLEHYDKGIVTIESLSTVLKKELFVTYEIAQQRSIFSNLNTTPPKEYPAVVFEDKKDIIIDLISLFNLYKLGLIEEFKKTFGKIFLVSQSWHTLLHEIEEFANRGDGTLWFHKDVPHPIVQNRDKKEDEDALKQLKDFKTWIANNCEIIPSKGMFNFKESDIDNLKKIFGLTIAHGFMEASANNTAVLYCDDSVARTACIPDKIKKLTYIVPFIEHLANTGIISLDRRSDMLLSLISRGYRNMPISFRDLAYAYNKGITSFSVMTKEISKTLPLRECVLMIYRVLYELHKNFSMPNDIQEFIDTLLQSFSQKQRSEIVKQFKKELAYKEILIEEDGIILNAVYKYKVC
ncbi:hypothetical protein Dip518_000817 [Parelusimicrobium proximum]|uniref:tetratricopeptide repeat protein n=1 Tax=Parelusimicrobium proximum TaxID=3228953 RepID=UPI003D1709A6